MRKFFLFMISCLCMLPNLANAQNKSANNSYAKANLSALIINAPNNTYGYDILLDGKMMIHQPSIPAMPGNEGFKTKADAKKTAELVISKIRKGEMPPTVSVEELKKLKVIK